jgi:hypothetical protein
VTCCKVVITSCSPTLTSRYYISWFPSVLLSPAMLVFLRTSPHVSPRASGLKFIRISSGLFLDFDRASLDEHAGLLGFFSDFALQGSHFFFLSWLVSHLHCQSAFQDQRLAFGVEVCDHFCFQFVSVFTIDGMLESNVGRECL